MAALGERNPVARWQRVLLDVALWALVASGGAWLALHYGVAPGDDSGLPSPAEPWLIRAHGLAAFALLIGFGAFLPWHVPRGWRMVTRRGIETTMLVLLGLAIVSAYALYYFAPESIHAPLGWAHAVAGVVAGLLVWWHRRRRSDLPRA